MIFLQKSNSAIFFINFVYNVTPTYMDTDINDFGQPHGYWVSEFSL